MLSSSILKFSRLLINSSNVCYALNPNRNVSNIFNKSFGSINYLISADNNKKTFSNQLRLQSTTTTPSDKKSVKSITVYFIDRDGEKRVAKAKIGNNLLDVAIDNNIDLEGFGACEGTLSCSTCHLILTKSDYDQLKPPSDEENDMLDLAFGLTETSRLGCQVTVTENVNGWTFVVPKEVNDARD